MCRSPWSTHLGLHGARQSLAPDALGGAAGGAARGLFSRAVRCLPWTGLDPGRAERPGALDGVDRGSFSPMQCVVEAMCHAGGIFAVIVIDRVGARRSWAPDAFSTRSDGHVGSVQQIHVRALKTAVFGNGSVRSCASRMTHLSCPLRL
jgi:hypothetical protein